jgi:hypothetical protein
MADWPKALTPMKYLIFLSILGCMPAAFAVSTSSSWNHVATSGDQRELVFQDAGLTSEIAAWDRLDQDLLWVRAHHFNADRLIQTYPNLDAQKLTKLVEIIANMRGEHQ